MQFQVNTPQTVGAHLAKRKSKKASERTPTFVSFIESATKKRKILNNSPPSAPDQLEDCATTSFQTTDVASRSPYSPLPLSQTQIHDTTDIGPATKTPKPEDCSVTPDEVSGTFDRELERQTPELVNNSSFEADLPHRSGPDLGPATRTQRLRCDDLPSTGIRERVSSEELNPMGPGEADVQCESWFRRNGFDLRLNGKIPDELFNSPSFNIDKYLLSRSSEDRFDASRASEPDAYPPDDSSAKFLTAEAPKSSCFSPTRNETSHMHSLLGAESLDCTLAQDSISRESPGPRNEPSCTQSIQSQVTEPSQSFDREPDTMFSSLSDRPSLSLPTTSNVIAERNITDASSNKNVSLVSARHGGEDSVAMFSNQLNSANSDCDMTPDTVSTINDHSAPSLQDSVLRDEGSVVESSPAPVVRPVVNKGGRPKGRKSKTYKTYKGPARFQKNRPVKARISVDIWENILNFCSPEFLLKARTISSTFRSVLKDDSLIWKRARMNYFDPDMPDPPLGLSEPQYADLLTGTGCHTRGCESTRARKTYWVFQKRLCVDCFHKMVLSVSISDE